MVGSSGSDLSAAPDLATRVGRRLRQRRTTLGLTLGEAAHRAKISDSHLSAIEIGTKVPSLPILARVVAVLDLSLYEILRDVAGTTVRAGRLRDEASGVDVVSHDDLILRIATLVTGSGDTGASPVPIGEREVFVYVARGRLRITVDGEPHDLGAGDSLDTDPAGEIGYHALGPGRGISIWASVPADDDGPPP